MHVCMCVYFLHECVSTLTSIFTCSIFASRLLIDVINVGINILYKYRDNAFFIKIILNK